MRTDPPAPPSPPEGPPFGTNFSRRKATQPLPPSPALTRMVAWSINVIVAGSARGVPTDYTLWAGSWLLECPWPENPKSQESRAKSQMKKPPEGGLVGLRRSKVESSLLGGHGRDRHETAPFALVLEVDDAVDLGIERVVASDSDVDAGIELRAALADDDRPAGHELPGEALDSQHF